MSVYVCVASRALQRAGSSFAVRDDETMQAQDTTAWFQRRIFRGTVTDDTITMATVHCCYDLLSTWEKIDPLPKDKRKVSRKRVWSRVPLSKRLLGFASVSRDFL